VTEQPSIFAGLTTAIYGHAYQLQMLDQIEEALEQYPNPSVITVTTVNGTVYGLTRRDGQTFVSRKNDERGRGWRKTDLHEPEPGMGLNTDVWITSPIQEWALILR
jgi:hypothetical protein